MSKEKLISCIVPVFNGERYLREALDSILKQNHRPLEIIVADDGSTDETRLIAESYGEPVRFVTQPTAGPPATRNLGLDTAQGDFIAFLDADDLWHASKLDRQMARFDARPELDACVTYIQNFWIPELQEEQTRLREHRMSKPLPGYVTMTLLARREIFGAVGPFNPELWHSDSMDWFLRAHEKGAIIECLPEVLVYHRMHERNLSRRSGTESREEFLDMVQLSLRKRRETAHSAAEQYHFPAVD